ncbi:hypothetical protein CGRA01v4_07250 [Colletotrichum graminicola]|uniref:Uncharacterized protein n=1 Tax=Colletotrichum graminicola (strain M1.001 / M2 / FGSC 10212) TaxID=645133 RepID=E3QCF6_COLGM|nr:uncharacterized protein GLRG_03688 [Colletotrichum graminicola M1.001]EFQ28544.1 hypothetical protein GLRG_03688 [Colletotrichum graminicola M1.001]WDK15969.1 hypothetical protein CGRA01v4_07250 [Colletotrichum graminicola]
MKFSLAIIATAMAAAVSAAPSTTPPLEVRQQCLPDAAPCERAEQCCFGRCTWGSVPPSVPGFPARCGNQDWYPGGKPWPN